MQHTNQLINRVIRVLPVSDPQGLQNELNSIVSLLESNFDQWKADGIKAKDIVDSKIAPLLDPYLTVGANNNIARWAASEIAMSLKNDLDDIEFVPGYFLFNH